MTLSSRDRVLHAAPTRYARHGYAATPLWEIAEDAGCSTATIQHHFHTKEALLAAIAQPFVDDVERALEGHEAGLGSDDRVALLEAYVKALMKHREVAKVVIHDTAAQMTDTGELVREQQRRFVGLLAGPRATLHHQVRAHCAMGILHLMVGDLVNVPAHRVHRQLVDAAIETLSSSGAPAVARRAEHGRRAPSYGPLA